MTTKMASRAKIITLEQLRTVRQPLPASLLRAAGLMRHKRKALERHLAKIRREWDR
ncbi:MAG: hypothetical protein AAB533_03130 [Patescibacteria group bacterium]